MNLGSALIVVLVGMLVFQFVFITMVWQIQEKQNKETLITANRSQVSSEERDRIIDQLDNTNDVAHNNSNDLKEIKQYLNISNHA